MLGISVFRREVAVREIDPGCVGDDIGGSRVNDAEKIHGLRVSRITRAGKFAAQAFFEKLVFVFGSDISVHDLRAWRGKASVLHGGEGGYVRRGASAENKVRVGGHSIVRLIEPGFDRYRDRSRRRSVANDRIDEQILWLAEIKRNRESTCR
jgi:hypothetical protein